MKIAKVGTGIAGVVSPRARLANKILGAVPTEQDMLTKKQGKNIFVMVEQLTKLGLDIAHELHPKDKHVAEARKTVNTGFALAGLLLNNLPEKEEDLSFTVAEDQKICVHTKFGSICKDMDEEDMDLAGTLFEDLHYGTCTVHGCPFANEDSKICVHTKFGSICNGEQAEKLCVHTKFGSICKDEEAEEDAKLCVHTKFGSICNGEEEAK